MLNLIEKESADLNEFYAMEQQGYQDKLDNLNKRDEDIQRTISNIDAERAAKKASQPLDVSCSKQQDRFGTDYVRCRQN